MAHHLITRDALGALTKLGQGGQGIVYQAPKVTTQFADRMVFKEYKPHARGDVSFEALAAMPILVEDTLPNRDGQELVSIAAWPCALVENGTGPVGFVMPAIPGPFHIDITTVKGRSQALAEFQHLLNEPSVLIARGVAITDVQRYQLLREVAKGLSFMHRIGVCVGDISPKNVLFSLSPRPAVYFVDCDAMRVNGVSALPQMETPEWEVPAGEELATTYSDTYKLGLLALRLLVGDQHTKNPHELPPTTPKPLRQLITDTLTKEPADRPVPQAWDYLLGQIIDETQQQQATDPPLTPPEPAVMTYTPEPPPVVRSRPPVSSTPNPAAANPIAQNKYHVQLGAKTPNTPSPGPAPSATGMTSNQKIYAGVAIGLLLIIMTMIALANQGRNGSSSTISRTPTTTSTNQRSPAPSPSMPLVEQDIRNASVGDCFRRSLGPTRSDGNADIVALTRYGCGNSGSEIRVVSRQLFSTATPPPCENSSFGQVWSGGQYPRVVLCFVYDQQ